MEGKWFADTLEGAVLHGRCHYPTGSFKVIAANVPGELVALLFRPRNLDGFGPATFVDLQYLDQIEVAFEITDG